MSSHCQAHCARYPAFQEYFFTCKSNFASALFALHLHWLSRKHGRKLMLPAWLSVKRKFQNCWWKHFQKVSFCLNIKRDKKKTKLCFWEQDDVWVRNYITPNITILVISSFLNIHQLGHTWQHSHEDVLEYYNIVRVFHDNNYFRAMKAMVYLTLFDVCLIWEGCFY